MLLAITLITVTKRVVKYTNKMVSVT